MEQTRQNIFVFLFHKKIFTKGPIYRRVMTRAVFVCLLKVNVWEFLLCRLCQSSSQFTNSHKSKGFLSSFTVALPIRKFVLNSCLLFSFVHQTLTSFKKEEAPTNLGNRFLWLHMQFDQKLLEQEVHFVYISRMHCVIRQFRCFFILAGNF